MHLVTQPVTVAMAKPVRLPPSLTITIQQNHHRVNSGITAATSSPPPPNSLYLSKPFQPLFSPSIVCTVPRYPFLFAPRQDYWAVRFSSCRRLTPLAQAGMETPTGVCCLAKLAINFLPPTFLFMFPLLSLVALYLLLFGLPFPFLFLWSYLAASLFFWEWPSPKKQPRDDSPFSGPGRRSTSIEESVACRSKKSLVVVGVARQRSGHALRLRDWPLDLQGGWGFLAQKIDCSIKSEK